jgi:hypothetical protein
VAKKRKPTYKPTSVAKKRKPTRKPTSTAKRPGRDLEQLVATIERSLHGAGIEITSPAHLPDRETGGDLREVDVLLRIRAGSTQLLVAFECRDRGRAQNVQWLEELAGRRNSLGVDKMVAVSSNGFSAAALKKAKARGIDLRVLSALTPDEVRRLVPFSELGILRTDARLIAWRSGGPRAENAESVGPAPTVASLDITLTEPCLRVPGTTELFSLQQLAEKYKSQILEAANAAIPTVRLPIADPSTLVGSTDESEVLRVTLNLPPLEEIWAGMVFSVESVEFDVVTTRRFVKIPLGPGQRYSVAEADDSPIAVRFEAMLPNATGLPERVEVLVFPTEQRLSVSAIQAHTQPT